MGWAGGSFVEKKKGGGKPTLAIRKGWVVWISTHTHTQAVEYIFSFLVSIVDGGGGGVVHLSFTCETKLTWFSSTCVHIGWKMTLQSAQNRLLIKNGKVVNADGIEDADVYIEDGVIKWVII